jgi:uncharacterized lipoprotein NlpE involved in copper resistance
MFRVLTGFLLLMVLPLFATHCASEDTATLSDQSESVPADPAHNSQNSLDWAGTYKGTLPCASCGAIKMEIVLQNNGTYEQTNVYQNDEESDAVISSGTFSWNEEGSTITLNNVEKPNQFFVGENYLAKLDIDGNRITGDLADQYLLAKTTTLLKDRFLKLVSLNEIEIRPDQTGPKIPHLILHSGEQRFTGSGGCNSINGTFRVEPKNNLSFLQIASTKMACADAAYESEFLNLLEHTRFYTFEGTMVHFKDSENRVVASFENTTLSE